MVSVSLSDVKDSNHPDRIEVVATESDVKTDNEHQYVAEVKYIIDGPHGRVVVLSRARGPSTDPGSEDVSFDDRYFYHKDGVSEISGTVSHLMLPTDGMLDSADAYLEEAERVAMGDPEAVYDQASEEIGWGGYSTK